MSHQDPHPLSEARCDAASDDAQPQAEPAAGFTGSYLELVFGTIDHAARARAD